MQFLILSIPPILGFNQLTEDFLIIIFTTSKLLLNRLPYLSRENQI